MQIRRHKELNSVTGVTLQKKLTVTTVSSWILGIIVVQADLDAPDVGS